MDVQNLVGRDAEREETQLEAMASLPDGLAAEMKRVEKLFWVDTEKLKEISKRFGEELAEGLQANGENIPMNLTWVLQWPTGHESGSFLTIDLGGTNLRVCWVVLTGKRGQIDIKQNQYELAEKMKTGNAEDLWNFIAECLEKFLEEHRLEADKDKPLNLGFTFSYPATQNYIDEGILQTWTKGFDIKGVEGEDAAAQLIQAIEKKELPIRLVVLINDTTGALIASAYNDPDTIIGAVFGTGCNAAYMEDCGSIAKVDGLSKDTLMAINCEYGAFDNSLQVLPRTPYDKTIDEESPRPGEQSFEKMSAGLYLGELFRLVLIDLYQKGLIFKSQDISKLKTPYSLDTSFLSFVENDESTNLTDTKSQFAKKVGIDVTASELLLSRRLAELIALRGARLSACGVAAICIKKGISKGHVAADGSVANKHPTFKIRWAAALGEILDWPESRQEDPITLTSAEDGSGFGAAVISALTMERAKRGEMAGIKQRYT